MWIPFKQLTLEQLFQKVRIVPTARYLVRFTTFISAAAQQQLNKKPPSNTVLWLRFE